MWTLRKSLGAIALCVAIATPVGEAWAAPSLEDALRFARRELNRTCDNPKQSWFDGIDERPVRRSCDVRLSAGALSLSVTYHRIGERSMRSERLDEDRAFARMSSFRPEDVHAGARRLEIDFDDRSFFVCGQENREGFAPLYMNCYAELVSSDIKCVTDAKEMWLDGGGRHTVETNRSFGLLFAMSGKTCNTVQRALNYVAKKSRRRREGVDAYFSD